MELEILKIYIKINPVNSFISLLISSIDALILFVSKSDNNFRLYINYQGFVNLIPKNLYLLPPICEFLNWLSRANRIILLDLTSA